MLTYYSRHPIADNKLVNLTSKHFEYLRDERLQKVKSGTINPAAMSVERSHQTSSPAPLVRQSHLLI